MTYEELLIEAEKSGYVVKEKPLRMHDGRIKGYRIAIRRDIPTTRQKAETLLEELEHGYSNCGNILDQSKVLNRRQELKARKRAYRRQLTFALLIKAYEAGCQSLFEISEELDISEDFLVDALTSYTKQYGSKPVCYDNHLIYFYPSLYIVKILESLPLVEQHAIPADHIQTSDKKSDQEYVIVKRWSDEEIRKKIERLRAEHEVTKKQFEKRWKWNNRRAELGHDFFAEEQERLDNLTE